MLNKWKVKVWGVRGSVPVSDTHFLTYGGNTSCISVDCGKSLVVFDAGSGLARLGESLAGEGRKRVDILLSHLHMDHIMGLFRFSLFYDREAEVHLYGASGEEGKFSEQLDMLLGPPLWPVSLKDCPAHVEIHELCPGQHFFLAGEGEETEKIRICTLGGEHPGGSLLYRLEADDMRMVYALDCESDGEMFQTLAEFSAGSDLIIWDASFTEEDRKLHRGWGHSSWEEGIDFCRQAGITKIVMSHYAPEYTDEFLKSQENKAEQTGVECYFAKEGMEIQI